MIGLVLGTSEGKIILDYLNAATDDIYISASSRYGVSIYDNYRFRTANSKPMDKEGFVNAIKEYGIVIFIDASHPFAREVSINVKEACNECGIKYYRYDRPGVYDNYKSNPLVFGINNYEEIKNILKGVRGTVLNTTGSKNIAKILGLGIPNRIVHRVLPIPEVIQKIQNAGVRVEDTVAMKMEPGFKVINEALIRAYEVKAIIAKDSGSAGGTVDKIETAIALGIKIIVMKKDDTRNSKTYSDIDKLIKTVLKEK